jgi:hypothetical protein
VGELRGKESKGFAYLIAEECRAKDVVSVICERAQSGNEALIASKPTRFCTPPFETRREGDSRQRRMEFAGGS